MKKIMLSLAVIAAFAVASCGNKNQEAQLAAPAEDSTEVVEATDSVSAEPTDSVSAEQAQEPVADDACASE